MKPPFPWAFLQLPFQAFPEQILASRSHFTAMKEQACQGLFSSNPRVTTGMIAPIPPCSDISSACSSSSTHGLLLQLLKPLSNSVTSSSSFIFQQTPQSLSSDEHLAPISWATIKKGTSLCAWAVTGFLGAISPVSSNPLCYTQQWASLHCYGKDTLQWNARECNIAKSLPLQSTHYEMIHN